MVQETLKSIAKEFGVIFGMDTWDKVGFEDTDIDLTNEPKGNLHATRFYPDSICRGGEDFFDATCAISYPNNKNNLAKAIKVLEEKVGINAYPTVTARWVLQDWDSEYTGKMPLI